MDELRAVGVPVTEGVLGEPIGAYVVELLGRLPRAGDTVDLGTGASAQVTGISRRRVTKLRVRLKKESDSRPGE
jgi:CBS domain containing-hemolysin-like protein